MEILKNNVDTEDIENFEKAYQAEKNNYGYASNKVKFEYAWALIGSKYLIDNEKGINLLEDLIQNDDNNKRQYLFYLIVSNSKIGNYQRALDCSDEFLKTEPGNRQVIELRKEIKKKVNKSLKNVALTGAVIGIGIGLVTFLTSLSKK